MRSLAGRFVCTPRALYRYIGDKDAMLEAVVEQQVSGLPRDGVLHAAVLGVLAGGLPAGHRKCGYTLA